MHTFLLPNDGPLFEHHYNRSCFIFAHTLHKLDIFDVERLVDISKRIPAAYYATGDLNVGSGWVSGGERASLQETLATIAESNSLVIMKGLADDPVFAPIFRELSAELLNHVGSALRSDVSVSRATIIVSSPHQITPYHMDAETNFLFQLRGKKLVSIFDPSDRKLLTHVELERFYSGDLNAATYKPDLVGDAAMFSFAPGDGLHIPLHAPHWVRNDDSVSVAISINFSLHSNRRLAQLYRFNHVMRKSGLSPAPPGVRLWQDRLKLAVTGVIGRSLSLRSEH